MQTWIEFLHSWPLSENFKHFDQLPLLPPLKFGPFFDAAGNDLRQLPGGVQGEPFLANCSGLFPKLELPSWDMAAGNDFFL